MPEPNRFFDAETGGEVQLQLQAAGADFRVLRQIGYLDGRYDVPFVVPADTSTFLTDLASIPQFFAWLVPGLGTHFPAILLHDGLVVATGEPKTHLGPSVDREEADRVLRDAMANLGTPLIRRWLIWTAVTLGTAVRALRPRWYWLPLVVVTLLTIIVLGVVATLDLTDVWDVLPWMGERSLVRELVGGATFAVVIPLALSALWGRLWKAGAIAGVALALLLHVTLALAVMYGVYWLAEGIVSAPEGRHPNVKRNLEQASTAP